MTRLMFGYRTLADKKYMEALLGYVPAGFPAKLRGYEVGLQEFHDMPDAVKNVVSKDWGETFKSYFVRMTNDPNDMVNGMAWAISDENEKILDDWEFDGLWFRKHPVEIYVYNGGNYDAFVYALDNGVGRKVRGMYNPFPVDKEKTLKLARENHLRTS